MKQQKRTTGKRTKPTKVKWGLSLDGKSLVKFQQHKFKCDVCGATAIRDRKVCPECGTHADAGKLIGKTTLEQNVAALTTERGGQHGDWIKQSNTAQRFKQVVRDSYNYHAAKLSDSQLEAVEMICVKLSRILTGDPSHEDHWRDVQGYAELGFHGHKGDSK